jgi:hypothetical protein
MAFECDLGEAGRFLDLIGEGEPHTFQWFDDRKKSGSAGHFYGHLSDVAPKLVSLNKKGNGIFFMVNEGDGQGRSGSNVTGVRALFVDLDGAPLEPVRDAAIEPNAIIESSPKRYQAYWLVRECQPEDFKALQVAMAAKFSGDASVNDLPRVMRVPGFYHCKGTPFRVRTETLEMGMPRDQYDLINGLNLNVAEARTTVEAPLPALDSMKPKSIPPGQRHEMLKRYAYKFATENRSPEEIAMLLDGINHRYCSEPKPDNEVADIVTSALTKVPQINLGRLVAKPTPPKEEEVFSPQKEESHHENATFALPQDLILSAPGLVGEIANWITETNHYWQPSYSLAAALAFVGMLKGHRVCTEQDGRTNLLTVAVGSSTSGKTVPLKRLQLLARVAGLSHRLNGEPTSESGMVKGLIESGHKAIIPWDEIGIAFKGMLSTHAPSFKAGIVRLLLKLYSMADETVLGFQYANADGKTPRADLHQPCLCLYGTTTQEGIFGAFSSVEAVNGFAARLLIFETHDYFAERQPIGKVTPPADLVEKVRKTSGEFDRPEGAGNLVGVLTTPEAVVVPFSQSARKLFTAAGREFEALKHKAIREKRPAEESIWGRAYEQSTKIALTVEDSTSITEESATWAIELVTQLCKRMIVAAREQIADNQTHAELNSVLKLVREASPQWVDSTYICRKTRSLPMKKRKEILASLVEEGAVEQKLGTTNGRTKSLFRYVR